ncbi:MAG: lytic transglycosylase domain-containing protein [Syntrophorhabdales bacterium]|jgi:membrane-bound lytic murein transglycosylase D
MRSLFVIAAFLAAFMLLNCPRTIAGGFGEKNPTVIEIQNEREGDLPDDPLSRQPSDKAPKKREEQVLALSEDGVIYKLKHAYWGIRDAIRRYTSPDGFDIPVVLNESVDRHIRCFTGPKRDTFAKWLVRARKYEPMIRDILRKNGLPEDLVYLAMIESGFNMKACSRVRAMGPWQFMDETGREYGLRVDYWVDERYDLEKSTVAAASYLKKLFDEFGCWYLVAASYNGGENKVRRAIEDHRTRDFWRLREYNALPRETQEYVPQLIAAALIAKEPRRYGFDDTRPSPVYRLTKVSVPGGLPLMDIAHASSVDLADLRALNPELLQWITPPDRKSYQIVLPGDKEGRRMNGLRWERRVVRVLQHLITAKDSVTGIERLYHVAGPDLLLVNADGLQMEKGRIVYIPRFEDASKDAHRTFRPRLVRRAAIGGETFRSRKLASLPCARF